MMRVRWRLKVAGLVALAGLGGCRQQVFLDPADYKDALTKGFPEHLETRPDAAVTPVTHLDRDATLQTVLDPTRPPQYVSLKQCIAIGLENGNIGLGGGTANAGFGSDSVGQFNGRGFGGTDTIRALVLDPALAQVAIERSVSKFDARLIGSMVWQNQDTPTPNAFSSFSVGDRATLTSSLVKPLPTGGTAGITWTVDYTNLTNAPQSLTSLNKFYTPKLQFSFEQPLMQGYGIEVNQISQNHPGSTVLNARPSGGTTTEGILITRIRFDQQRAEFDRQINQYLLGVESAYWNLYAAYYNLYSAEEVLKQAGRLLYVVYERVRTAQNLRMQQYLQTAAQFNQFRQQVVAARQQVLSSERQLRSYLGMRTDDKVRLVPIDDPALALVIPSHYEAAMTALAQRPDLLQARQEIKAQQLNIILQKNNRRPDVRFFSTYDIAGIGPRLDGPESINALANFANNQFNSWTLGIRADIPIGFRDAQGAVREAQLGLQRSYWTLAEGERKVIESVYTQIQNLISNHEQIKFAKAQRDELAETLRLDTAVLDIGQWDVAFLNQLLINQQNFARALSEEFRLVAEYQKSLAALEFSKGTIQQYDNVSVAEGALPAYVQKKAADHFRERDAALKLREHSAERFLPALPDMAPLDMDKLAVPPEVPGKAVPPVNPLPVPMAPKDKEPTAGLTVPIGIPLPSAKPVEPFEPQSLPTEVNPTFTADGTVKIQPTRIYPRK